MLTILISRTDNIGDVIFTLPMATIIKQQISKCRVIFLGRNYTKDIILSCSSIDEFYSLENLQSSQDPVADLKNLKCDIIIHVFPNKFVAKLARMARIPTRIGTNRRLYHWFTCNQLVTLSRKNSPLHEAQLNLKLCQSFLMDTEKSLTDIAKMFALKKNKLENTAFDGNLDKNKFNLIIHPLSNKSAQEWGLNNYVKLCNLLPQDKFKIFVTGTINDEPLIIKNLLPYCPHVHNMVGKFSLHEFMNFIQSCDGLVACSTGPLHLASTLGIHTLGLYPPIKGMLPQRWGSIGEKAQNITAKSILNSNKKLCRKKVCKMEARCKCMEKMCAESIAKLIEEWVKC